MVYPLLMLKIQALGGVDERIKLSIHLPSIEPLEDQNSHWIRHYSSISRYSLMVKNHIFLLIKQQNIMRI